MWITNFAIETNKPFSKLLRNSSGGMLHHSNLGGGRDTWVPVHLASTSICIRIMIRKLVIIVTMKIKWLWGRRPPPYEAWYQFSGLSEHCKARKKTWKYIAMTCLIYITLLDKSWQYTFKSFLLTHSWPMYLKVFISKSFLLIFQHADNVQNTTICADKCMVLLIMNSKISVNFVVIYILRY